MQTLPPTQPIDGKHTHTGLSLSRCSSRDNRANRRPDQSGASGRRYPNCPCNRSQELLPTNLQSFSLPPLPGTPVKTLQQALAENGQYLPFDPVCIEQGATLGGTIASGISGPDRLLYGSLRDFVMEVELIDGLGRLVRGGGKVVKNSAGFDLPKLMVGSYGRLGVLTEATLKVFPKPPAYLTQQFEFPQLSDVVAAMQKLQTNPLPISALEIETKREIAGTLRRPPRSVSDSCETRRTVTGLCCLTNICTRVRRRGHAQ